MVESYYKSEKVKYMIKKTTQLPSLCINKTYDFT